MILETGIIGLLGYFVVCAGALLALQRAKRRAQNAGARAALLATQLLFLPFYYGSVLFNHTASAFVWMIFAAVLAAAELNTKQDAMPPLGVRLNRSERLRLKREA
jgi:O-antigen ligase